MSATPLDVLLALIGKSGVQDYKEASIRLELIDASLELTNGFLQGLNLMTSSKLLIKEIDGVPKQIIFADHAGDFGPIAANDLRVTTDGSKESDVQLSLAALANNAFRQSNKVDLGSKRAELYKIRAAIEIAATPTAQMSIEFYWAPSHSSVAENGNAGAIVGIDSLYTGYSSDQDVAIKQLDLIGAMQVAARATPIIQIGEVTMLFAPTTRYGTLVVCNRTGAAFHIDDVEMQIAFDPIIPEMQ